jgi:hypothetical protein
VQHSPSEQDGEKDRPFSRLRGIWTIQDTFVASVVSTLAWTLYLRCGCCQHQAIISLARRVMRPAWLSFNQSTAVLASQVAHALAVTKAGSSRRAMFLSKIRRGYPLGCSGTLVMLHRIILSTWVLLCSTKRTFTASWQ